MNQAIPFQRLSLGYTPLDDRFEPTARVFVFRQLEDWQQFWQNGTRLDLNFQPMTAPDIDFDTQMVIGFTTGSRPDDRLQLHLDRIESVASLGGDRWRLYYTERFASNAYVAQKPTTPHLFVTTALADAALELTHIAP